MQVEKLYKFRLLMFLFKNKHFFHLHNTEFVTRQGRTTRALTINWKKEHSRMQARYQGYQLFNKPPAEMREEKKLSKFKAALKKCRDFV